VKISALVYCVSPTLSAVSSKDVNTRVDCVKVGRRGNRITSCSLDSIKSPSDDILAAAES